MINIVRVPYHITTACLHQHALTSKERNYQLMHTKFRIL